MSPGRVCRLSGVFSVDRNEDGMAELAADGFRQVALAGDVLDQDDLAGADHAGLAVAGGDLHAGVEVDDVLAARRRMPIQVVVAGGLAEDNAGGGQTHAEFAGVAGFDPFDLDVTEVGLTVGGGVEIVDTHGRAASPLDDVVGGKSTGCAREGTVSVPSGTMPTVPLPIGPMPVIRRAVVADVPTIERIPNDSD